MEQGMASKMESTTASKRVSQTASSQKTAVLYSVIYRYMASSEQQRGAGEEGLWCNWGNGDTGKA